MSARVASASGDYRWGHARPRTARRSLRPAARLGAGRYGRGARGFDTVTGTVVAIKLLHPGYDTHPDYQRRFWAEAHAAAGSGTHRHRVRRG
jgi:hypothetical protein